MQPFAVSLSSLWEQAVAHLCGDIFVISPPAVKASEDKEDEDKEDDDIKDD